MKDFVLLVIEWVGRYVGGLSDWIENYGGWVCYMFKFLFFFLYLLFEN